MQEEDMDMQLKVIIVGNGQVGKTSLITRFAKGVMTETYKKTIGTDFMEKDITIRQTGEPIKLLLWDTAGQEMFSKLTRQYYRGAGAVVYVFSTVDRESFLAIPQWQAKVQEECGEDIAQVLVQNKCDLIEQAEMTSEEVEAMAHKLGVKLYRIAVKQNLLVDDVFDYLAECYTSNEAKTNKAMPSAKEIAQSTQAEANTQPTNNLLQATINATPSAQDSSATHSQSASRKATAETTATDSATNSNKSKNSAAAAAAAVQSPLKGKQKGKKGESIVSLQPLTRRTGGKKKLNCTIL